MVCYSFYLQIVNFIKGTVAESAPIIPISAQLKYNIDVVCDYIVNSIPIPVRDFTSDPRLIGMDLINYKANLANIVVITIPSE